MDNPADPQASPRTQRRRWVAEPEVSETAVVEATGRGWNNWCDTIEASGAHASGHSEIARYLHEHLDVEYWWAQTIAVGFERITGLRLAHQYPDGSFRASKSKTVNAALNDVRSALIDDKRRAELFGGTATNLRSKPTSKALRFDVGSGVAIINFTPKPDGRTTLSVGHEGLEDPDAVQRWKAFWARWLDNVDEVI